MTKILEVDYKGEIIKGPLLKEDNDYFMIKLSSGYNANLLKKNCKIISESEQEDTKITTQTNQNNKKTKENQNLPKITILHTGGTIASKVDYRTGAVSSKFTPEELMNLFPELNEIANITTKLIGNLFSEDMRFQEYNLMLKEINSAIENKTEAIIIAHGTDTLHYTSAALQYATQNLNIPIILVGSQRSSDRPSSDAFSNLFAATQFIIQNNNKKKSTRFNRVGICMHSTTNDDKFTILDGINAKKMHSTQRDAFKQINYKPYAEINLFKNNKIEIFRSDLETETNKEEFSYTEFNEQLKIGFFKVHPNMFAWELDHLPQYDAVVIEGTGIGNIPQNNDNKKQDKNILNKLHQICDETKVFSGVQTVYGEVSLDIYSRGRDIQNTGIIGNRVNLTTESTFCRIAHILSKENIDFEEEWDKNLEGFEKISKQIK